METSPTMRILALAVALLMAGACARTERLSVSICGSFETVTRLDA